MEEQEAGPAAGCLAVAVIQAVDGGRRGGQQSIVARDLLARSVEPIGQQREAQVALGVGQEADLQAVDLRLDVRLVGEQRRDDDERARARTDAVGQLEPRQRPRAERDASTSQLTNGDRDLRGRHEGERAPGRSRPPDVPSRADSHSGSARTSAVTETRGVPR